VAAALTAIAGAGLRQCARPRNVRTRVRFAGRRIGAEGGRPAVSR
jgi:hypothetical protein